MSGQQAAKSSSKIKQAVKNAAVLSAAGFFIFSFTQMFFSMLPDATQMSATYESQGAFVRRIKLPPGYRINLYAAGLGRARGMTLTPKGDIIVSSPGVEMLLVRADANGDGKTDGVETLMEEMRSPHGVYLDGNWLYIAETSRVIRIRYDVEKGKIIGEREVMVDGLPTGDGYWSRTIKKGPDGAFYVSVGASCDACIEEHPWRATMLRFEPGSEPQVYATGLRNTVGFDWRAEDGALYGVEMGRNRLGDDIPPDELNLIVEGGFYGWPYVHGDDIPDPELGQSGGDRAAEARKPACNLAAHVSPMAIRFLKHQKSPHMRGAALVTMHGSWNRRERVGFGILSLHWDAAGKITERSFLTGFDAEGEVSGRPLEILEAEDGTLFLGDDFSGAIWRISYSAPSS